MKLNEGKITLEKLINDNISLIFSESVSIYEISYDSKDLYDAISELDDNILVKVIPEKIDNYIVNFYDGETKDFDYLGIIITDDNGGVVAYGYNKI